MFLIVARWRPAPSACPTSVKQSIRTFRSTFVLLVLLVLLSFPTLPPLHTLSSPPCLCALRVRLELMHICFSRCVAGAIGCVANNSKESRRARQKIAVARSESVLFGAVRRCSVLFGAVRCCSALFGAFRCLSVPFGPIRTPPCSSMLFVLFPIAVAYMPVMHAARVDLSLYNRTE